MPEIVTDFGEVADGGYIPWIKDLHGTVPAWLAATASLIDVELAAAIDTADFVAGRF